MAPVDLLQSYYAIPSVAHYSSQQPPKYFKPNMARFSLKSSMPSFCLLCWPEIQDGCIRPCGRNKDVFFLYTTLLIEYKLYRNYQLIAIYTDFGAVQISKMADTVVTRLQKCGPVLIWKRLNKWCWRKICLASAASCRGHLFFPIFVSPYVMHLIFAQWCKFLFKKCQ